MLRFKGEEFVRKLHGQNISMHAMFAQALNDLIISGEVEASPTIFRNHVLVAIEKKSSGGVGSDGSRTGKRREHRVFGSRAAPSRGGSVHRFHFQPGRGRKFLRVSITVAH